MNNFKETTIENLVEFQRGYDLPKSQFKEGKYPVRSSSGILGYHNEYKTKAPGITIGRSGTVGLPHYINENFFPHNTTLFIKDFKGNNAKYIYYLINNLKLNDWKSGSGVPTLNRNHIHPIKIFAYFDLKSQQQIAKVLSDLDAKIEVNNQINAKLEAMAKTLYEYWFVQFDFPDAEGKHYKSSGGKMVYNEELKREIPDGWEVRELKDIAKCIMGQSPKGSSYNKKNIGMPLLNGPADYENGALKGNLFTTEPKRICEKDDLVLCIRATIGNLVYSEQEFCLGRGVAAVRPNAHKMSELTYYYLIQEIERFKIQATGSIIRGISKDDLINSKCFIPHENLIESFHNKIKPMFDNIRSNKKQNQKLAELRDWLLPMLMNGQVMVSENSNIDLAQEAKKRWKMMKDVNENMGMVAEEKDKYGEE